MKNKAKNPVHVIPKFFHSGHKKSISNLRKKLKRNREIAEIESKISDYCDSYIEGSLNPDYEPFN